jgi:hypothetical protein
MLPRSLFLWFSPVPKRVFLVALWPFPKLPDSGYMTAATGGFQTYRGIDFVMDLIYQGDSLPV